MTRLACTMCEHVTRPRWRDQEILPPIERGDFLWYPIVRPVAFCSTRCYRAWQVSAVLRGLWTNRDLQEWTLWG